MNDQRKISISIPTWNRFEETMESFMDVYYDDRIEQITIVDDASDFRYYEQLAGLCSHLEKVNLRRNESNSDCYRNKYLSLVFTYKQRSILLDSDNKISKDYIDKLYSIPEWDSKTIYTPSFASPHFDFRAYEGITVTKENVAEYIDKPMFEVMLNAANFFVDRNEYIRIWDRDTDPVTSDSIYFCLKWLEAGNKIYVVPGLTYHHRVWEDSHYQKNQHRTPQGFHESILQKLRELK